MAIYNLYIFDRHCNCVSYTNFSQARVAAGGQLQGNGASSIAESAASAAGGGPVSGLLQGHLTTKGPNAVATSLGSRGAGRELTAPRPPSQRDAASANKSNTHPDKEGDRHTTGPIPTPALNWEEDAKLVYGVIYSLRNMTSRLVGESTV